MRVREECVVVTMSVDRGGMTDLDSALALVAALRREKDSLRAECEELRETVIQTGRDTTSLSAELVSVDITLPKFIFQFWPIFYRPISMLFLQRTNTIVCPTRVASRCTM